MRYVAIFAVCINADSKEDAKEKALKIASSVPLELDERINLYGDPELELSGYIFDAP